MISILGTVFPEVIYCLGYDPAGYKGLAKPYLIGNEESLCAVIISIQPTKDIIYRLLLEILQAFENLIAIGSLMVPLAFESLYSTIKVASLLKGFPPIIFLASQIGPQISSMPSGRRSWVSGLPFRS